MLKGKKLSEFWQQIKDSHKINVQVLAEPEIKPRPLWLELSNELTKGYTILTKLP